MSTSTAPEAEQIQREMRKVRTELRDNVRELVESAREMTVWQRYVKAYPWTCLGAAAFVGYIIIPSRSRVIQPDAKQMSELVQAQLAAHSTLAQKPKRPIVSSLVSSVAGMALNTLLQNGVAILGQQVNQYVENSLKHRTSEPHHNGTGQHHV